MQGITMVASAGDDWQPGQVISEGPEARTVALGTDVLPPADNEHPIALRYAATVFADGTVVISSYTTSSPHEMYGVIALPPDIMRQLVLALADWHTNVRQKVLPSDAKNPVW